MYKSLLVAALVIASIAPGAGAKIFTVPSGATPTIQAAVDSAGASGDLIQISGGTYNETGIVVNGKSVTIEPVTGQVVTLVYSSGSGTCITVRNASGGTILSIIFKGYGTAVALENSSATVQFATLKGCNKGVTIAGPGGLPKVMYSVVDSCATGVEVQGGSATLQNETIVNCTTGVSFLGGSATLSRSILYHCQTGVQCSGGSGALSCGDFWFNGADYSGCASGTNDFYLDPKFCFWASSAGPYWPHSSSPCLVKSANPCNAFIGAVTTPGCLGTAVQESSWGAIKAIFR